MIYSGCAFFIGSGLITTISSAFFVTVSSLIFTLPLRCIAVASVFFSSLWLSPSEKTTGMRNFTLTIFPSIIPGFHFGIEFTMRRASASNSGATDFITFASVIEPSFSTTNWIITRPVIFFWRALAGYLTFSARYCIIAFCPPGNVGICSFAGFLLSSILSVCAVAIFSFIETFCSSAGCTSKEAMLLLFSTVATSFA